jgi:membrane protein DedA with SNARE-associated domain
MDWATAETYIRSYGYLAIMLGTVMDHSGLTMFVVVGGALSSRVEHFWLWGVILAGTAGSMTSDIALFSIGRWRANWLDRFVKSDKNKMRLKLLTEGMNSYALPFLIFGRFIPWFGRFVPAAAGLRHVSFATMLLSCTLGALLGGTLYGLLGYFVGESAAVLEDYGPWVLLGTLLISFPVAAIVAKRFDVLVEQRLQRSIDKKKAGATVTVLPPPPSQSTPTEPGAQ